MRYNSRIFPSHRSTLDGFSFDSELEKLTYKTIIESYPLAFVEREPTVIIKPKTNHFPNKIWKPDFYFAINDCIAFIECKGILSTEFKFKLSLVEYFNPTLYNKLIIVYYKDTGNKFNRFCNRHKIKHCSLNNLPQLLGVLGNG